AGSSALDAGPLNPELFNRLRALRKRLADEEGVPAYIVFSDAVLRQMAAAAPKSRDGLLALSGVGPVKLERYGDVFLELLREQWPRAAWLTASTRQGSSVRPNVSPPRRPARSEGP